MPYSLMEVVRLRFCSESPELTSLCTRCHLPWGRHDNARCPDESEAQYFNFLANQVNTPFPAPVSATGPALPYRTVDVYQIRFGTRSPSGSSVCRRCGLTFNDNHRDGRCYSACETIEHYRAFRQNGTDEAYPLTGYRRCLSNSQAMIIRFGTGALDRFSRCKRCHRRYDTHNGARCSDENETHYETFLFTGETDILPMPPKEVIKIGADPEFELKRPDGEFLSADNLIRDGDRSHKFGCDGCSSTGEIRPDPGTPEVVMTSISRILDQGLSIVGRNEMYAGAGSRVPLGGHLHFSGVEVDQRILTMLDELIAKPLRLISNTRLRSSHSYGSLSEYRTQEEIYHGWEYRSPCSWITHPVIAAGVLNVAYECAKAYQDDENIRFARPEDLISHVQETNPTAAEKIKKFYNVIEKMEQSHAKLEQVEVFQAWKKRAAPTAEPVEPSIKVVFEWKTTDHNMPAIRDAFNKHKNTASKENTTELRTLIVGISKDKDCENAVYLPDNWWGESGKHNVVRGTQIKYWSSANIGLTDAVRQDAETCADVLMGIRKIRQRGGTASVLRILDEEEESALKILDEGK